MNVNAVVMSLTGKTPNGGAFPKVRILSCEFQLGINQIPVAFVGVDPCDSTILQSMEDLRRSECKITVAVGGQKLVFDCLFDGLSFSMAPGGMSYTAVFKSMFQTWLEVFPFAPGVHPLGINPFLQQHWIKMGEGVELKGALADPLLASIAKDIGNSDNLAEAIVKLFSNIITYNVEQGAIRSGADTTGAQVNPHMLENVLNQMAKGKGNPNYRKSLEAAEKLTSKIDLTAIKGFKINIGQLNYMTFLTNVFLRSCQVNDLWSGLVNALNILGAVIVPSLDKLYVVPECYFLKPSSRKIPSQQEFVNAINFASPGYYDNISLSDNGFKDVSAVAIVVKRELSPTGEDMTPNTEPFSFLGSHYATQYYGSFPDISEEGDKKQIEKLRGGLLVLDADMVSTLYALYPPNVSKPDQEKLPTTPDGQGQGSYPAPMTEEQAKGKTEATNKNVEADKAIREILNNLAQAKFFQAKYADRTGNINMLFNTRWMPGTTGTAFSRYPDPKGMFVDFYVTQVRHVFTPGTAVTQISFNGGRIGENPVGLDEMKIYAYTVDKMKEIQSKYVADFT